MPDIDHRPTWSAVPACLFCGWDDVADWADFDPIFTTFAAYLDERGPGDRPFGNWIEERNYVAWLCSDCSNDGATVAWFTATVKTLFRTGTFVSDPGTPREIILGVEPDGPLRIYRSRKPESTR